MNYREAMFRQTYLYKFKQYTVVRQWYIDAVTREPQYHLEDSSQEACDKEILSNCANFLKSQHLKKNKPTLVLIKGGASK